MYKVRGGIQLEPQETPTFRGEVEEERPIGNQKGIDRRKIRREWIIDVKAGKDFRKEYSHEEVGRSVGICPLNLSS